MYNFTAKKLSFAAEIPEEYVYNVDLYSLNSAVIFNLCIKLVLCPQI
jgi:hypothetical protein